MELASMLTGERFTDHPRSVCPVIASLLRAYNDAVNFDRRQELYVYAARAVGSASSGRLQEARADALRTLLWDLHVRRRRWLRFLPYVRRAIMALPVDAAAAAVIAHCEATVDLDALAVIDGMLAPGSPGATSRAVARSHDASSPGPARDRGGQRPNGCSVSGSSASRCRSDASALPSARWA
jgi:hypothetical protein